MYKEVSCCRICGNPNLETVLKLGDQALTGLFPKSANVPITVGPLTLVKCVGLDTCGLLQLKHSYTLSEMYGDNYGYRSGLNASMVAHLRLRVEKIKAYNLLEPGDLVLDIGSNDGTTLAQYERDDLTLLGMDPTALKFVEHYIEPAFAIPDFFSATTFKEHMKTRKAKVITSFSMFYDLEDPISFVKDIAEVLDDEGIWVLEQSYMPLMLDTNAYDTICHEHLEYYSLTQIDWIVEKCGMRVINVELNDINGGSFAITVQKEGGALPVLESVHALRDREKSADLADMEIYAQFRARVEQSRSDLLDFLTTAKNEGKTIVALGASTKGNVVLQYCNVDDTLISAVGEVNPDKFGSVTPGTNLPIVNEQSLLASNPDYALVLPWHFRKFFEEQSRYDAVTLVYALPKLEIRKPNDA